MPSPAASGPPPGLSDVRLRGSWLSSLPPPPHPPIGTASLPPPIESSQQFAPSCALIHHLSSAACISGGSEDAPLYAYPSFPGNIPRFTLFPPHPMVPAHLNVMPAANEDAKRPPVLHLRRCPRKSEEGVAVHLFCAQTTNGEKRKSGAWR